MKTYEVYYNDNTWTVYADRVTWDKDGLVFLRNNEIVSLFLRWDGYYELFMEDDD